MKQGRGAHNPRNFGLKLVKNDLLDVAQTKLKRVLGYQRGVREEEVAKGKGAGSELSVCTRKEGDLQAHFTTMLLPYSGLPSLMYHNMKSR